MSGAADGAPGEDRLPPTELVRRAADRWAGRLDLARDLRAGGAGGAEVAAALSDAADACVRDLFAAARGKLPAAAQKRDRTCVLAVGGTGRRQMSPHSDVDLLLLAPPAGPGTPGYAASSAVAKAMVAAGWDAGLPLSVLNHSPRSAWAAARAQIETATSLLDARVLCGDAARGRRFAAGFRRGVRRRRVRFCRAAVHARRAEKAAHGGTPKLLEPDLKRSPGGLRDAHLLRWVALAACGTCDPAALQESGALSPADAAALTAGTDALLAARCDLHLHAGRTRDVFTRSDQLDLIPPPGATGRAARDAVGAFMRGFLTATEALAEASDRFAARHRPRGLRTRLARSLRRPRRGRADGLTVGPRTLDVPPARRGPVAADPLRVLAVYEAAAATGSLPSPELADAVREAVPHYPPRVPPDVAAAFLRVLAGGPHVGAAVRSLHRLGVLSWLLPPLARIDCLTQFNQYHSFTVDEHSLRCVEAACGMLTDPPPAAGVRDVEPLGGCDAAVSAARRAVTDPALLNLAVLLHDCGKGGDRDHSVVGAELCEGVAARLGLSPDRRARLVWLVANHLMMTHLVLRRDTADPALVFRFARDVGDVPLLRKLYVLSAADLRGVGPDAWTAWKGDLLASFHAEAKRVLDGGRPASEAHAAAVRDRAADAFAAAGPAGDRPARRAWAAGTLARFSPHLVTLRDPARLNDDLELLHGLPASGAAADGRFDPATGTTEYRLAASDASPGLFARLAGVLAARRLSVVEAVAESLDGGGVLDLFKVVDGDFRQELASDFPVVPVAPGVPDWRLAEVAAALAAAAENELHPEDEPAAGVVPLADVPRAIAAARPFGEAPPALPPEPSRVTFDTESSDTCAVFDVFAADAPGLMFALARTLADLGLPVRLAKIGTHLDQVVDVFYVTDAAGEKLTDPDRLEATRAALLACVERLQPVA